MNTQTTPEAVKHTPGPWEVRDNKIFVPGTYTCIATVSVVDNYHPVSFIPKEDIECMANCQLIASAPTMKAQIEELTKQRDEARKTVRKAIDFINRGYADQAFEILTDLKNSLSPTQDK